MSLTRDRRIWLVSGALVAGIAIGLIVSFTGSATRRAEAAVLVSSKRGPTAVGPFLPDLKTLATSSLLAGNVRSTLRLSASAESLRRRLHASIRPNTQVIVISATGKDARSAEQLAQEAAVVLALLVGERFRTTTPPLQANVLDPAHVLGGPDRHLFRNALIGGVLGLIVGTVGAVLFVEAPGPPVGAPPRAARDLMRREQLLERRIKTVTARERELASRAGALTSQERQLAKLEHELEKRAAGVLANSRDLPQPEPKLEQEQHPPSPARAESPSGPRVGGWNIDDLDALVTASEEQYPGQIEEWRAYLFFLRDHASVNGDLPSQFDSLIEEVFGILTAS